MNRSLTVERDDWYESCLRKNLLGSSASWLTPPPAGHDDKPSWLEQHRGVRDAPAFLQLLWVASPILVTSILSSRRSDFFSWQGGGRVFGSNIAENGCCDSFLSPLSIPHTKCNWLLCGLADFISINTQTPGGNLFISYIGLIYTPRADPAQDTFRP